MLSSSKVHKQLEKPANTDSSTLDTEARIQLSIAISLKRIADAMTEMNEYGEVGGKLLSRAIVNGLRG